MTTRTDIVTDFNPSPRIIEVPITSTEFVAQDIVDTLRVSEQSFQGLGFKKLLDASGKENLGGGVSVGITVSLRDTQVAFEGRTSPAQTGTITSSSLPPVSGKIQLIDSSATFITNGISRGSLVINFTDQSIAEVFSVDSETQLTTKTLVNGIGNTFDIPDVYHVFNIIQCDLTGGNVVAVDSVGADISPILPTAFTQVVRTASSSATALQQKLIEFASFQNAVWIDVLSPYSGISTPPTIGSREFPVNNTKDALDIAIFRGLDDLKILGSITFGVGDTIPGYTIRGQSAVKSVITLEPSAVVNNCQIYSSIIIGEVDSSVVIRECVLAGVTLVSGFVFQSAIASGTTILLAGGATANILQCYAGNALDPGSFTPVIDMGGAGQSLSLRDYNGDIKIINKTGPEYVIINMSSGSIEIDSTVTAGTVLINGICTVIDNTAGGIVVDNSVSNKSISSAVWSFIIESTPTVGSYGEFVVKKLLTFRKFLGLK